MPPIGLITDLGDKDYFVGAMKGEILSINPKAKIVDISHQIPKRDMLTGAFVLANAAETFPKGSTFVAVIDPGVGTERRCIFLRTGNGLNFIGPDNGIFTLVARNFGVEELREVSNRKLMRSEISTTFHGRDIMAPVGAHLSLGVEPSELGPEIDELNLLKFKEPRLKGDRIRGLVMRIDDFGNLVTNIGDDLVKKFATPGTLFKVKVGGTEFDAPFVETFGEVSGGAKLCFIGSANLLEIAKNRGNLADEMDVEVGGEVTVGMVR